VVLLAVHFRFEKQLRNLGKSADKFSFSLSKQAIGRYRRRKPARKVQSGLRRKCARADKSGNN